MSALDLAAFRTLSFDCYGTLIDWEAGIVAALQPLLRHNDMAAEPAELLAAFARHETTVQQADPAAAYPTVLTRVHGAIAADLDCPSTPELDEAFGVSVGGWPAFADSAESLQRLARRYRLVILSNVDEASFALSAATLGVDFDAVYTAQQIGSYKPDPANFAYLLAAETGPLLHVAQSLYHDHAPAQAAGMRSVWIERPTMGATPDASGATYDLRFDSLADFATAAGV